ncbi:MAG: hypothetical protein EA342_02890 [Leptolyngbya sp. LCM1.Bin17]|nr:MAG: hypothetical protein EA342_02890 [Leptolyngbya sp. LCM1.Bin17]
MGEWGRWGRWDGGRRGRLGCLPWRVTETQGTSMQRGVPENRGDDVGADPGVCPGGSGGL